MACPDFQAFMLPMMEVLSDGKERTIADLRDLTATRMGLTDADRTERVSSGKRLAYIDRGSWACTYLSQAGLVTWVRRGVYQISATGRSVLAAKPTRLDVAFLRNFPEFSEWLRGDQDSVGDQAAPTVSEQTAAATPLEQISAGYSTLRRSVETELIQKILSGTPAFFEQLVVELLVKMGYGGSLADAGQAVGRSGDDGIDGVIKEDKLGLDMILVQAKRWQPAKKVSRPDVQAFAGSLEGQRARKGVFITTSSFTEDAHGYVARIEKKIILIDGAHLARLLFDHGVGVRTKEVYEVKEVDDEYFIDD